MAAKKISPLERVRLYTKAARLGQGIHLKHFLDFAASFYQTVRSLIASDVRMYFLVLPCWKCCLKPALCFFAVSAFLSVALIYLRPSAYNVSATPSHL
jgi:hypothetical protein